MPTDTIIDFNPASVLADPSLDSSDPNSHNHPNWQFPEGARVRLNAEGMRNYSNAHDSYRYFADPDTIMIRRARQPHEDNWSFRRWPTIIILAHGQTTQEIEFYYQELEVV